MTSFVPVSSPALPALVAAAGERASMRFLEFFAANIRNPHTRRAFLPGSRKHGNARIAYLACVQLSHNPSTQVLEG